MMSSDQEKAFDGILLWAQRSPPGSMATLAGYAGCGKSWLVAELGREWQRTGLDVVYVAPTGKAALVAGKMLAAAGIDAVSTTIHSAFLRPVEDDEVEVIDGVEQPKEKREVRWAMRDRVDGDPHLIVVDEASMLTADVLRAAQSTCPTSRFLFVGDHFQLPAIGQSAGVMDEPDWRLETIMRQADGSPIIHAAHLIRTESIQSMLKYARGLSGSLSGSAPLLVESQRLDDNGLHNAVSWTYDLGWDDGMIVVAKNATRMRVNRAARSIMREDGSDDAAPYFGDTMMCEMNTPALGMVNGERFRVSGFGAEAPGYLSIMPGSRTRLDCIDIADRADYHSHIRKARAFAKDIEKKGGDPRDFPFCDSARDLSVSYGYALTCHKAQGSQAKRVVVALGDKTWGSTDDTRRWAYTAMTRASESVRIVGNL